MSASLIAGCDHTTPSPSAPPLPATSGGERSLPPSSDAVTCSDGNTVDFSKSTPPLDIDPSKVDNEGALAAFAWQHFIALNWPAAYPRTGQRGTPDTTMTSFIQPSDSDTTTVWESYRNKNEMFPVGASVGTAKPNSDYNAAPVYHYSNGEKPNGEIGPCDDKNDKVPNRLVNLDENSQLGLAYMFAKPQDAPGPQQVMFLAKINKVNYDYIVSNALYDKSTQDVYAKNNKTLGYYGMCQQTNPICLSLSNATTASENGNFIPDAGSYTGQGNGKAPFPPSYCLPCGGKALDDSPSALTSEGTIHVKAAWRRLTSSEATSGKYLTAPVVIYKQQSKDKLCYSNDKDQKWGLVGLHIIHKTANFPQFFFATWEHVDNLKSNLTYMNTAEGGPANTVGVMRPYQRAQHNGLSLPSRGVGTINTCVQNGIRQSSNPKSVWQNYQLVGVQGKPVDRADLNRPGVLPNYYLANNVIESNDFFQSFLGAKGKYHVVPAPPPAPQSPALPDGYYVAPNLGFRNVGVTVDGGGCQGCHGNSQTQLGFDMSFLSAGFSDKAEAIGDFETRSLRLKYLEMIRPAATGKP